MPIAFMIGEVIDATTRVYFIRKTYQDLRLKPLFPSWQQFRQFLSSLSPGNAFLAYFAGICLNIENFLMLLFFYRLRAEPNLLIYLYILRQIYRAYSQWGLIFYYDLKKMTTLGRVRKMLAS